MWTPPLLSSVFTYARMWAGWASVCPSFHCFTQNAHDVADGLGEGARLRMKLQPGRLGDHVRHLVGEHVDQREPLEAAAVAITDDKPLPDR